MRRTRLLPLALSLLSAPLPPALAQGEAPPPAGQFEERIEVGEALLDALVTDRRGNVVLGLGPGDFRVTVDGRPAEVTAATFYSNRRFLDAAGNKPPGLGEPAAPDRRYFVLFFDDQRTEAHENPPLLSRQLEAGRAAERWLREELLPNDLVAVAGFTSRLELHQDFTNDLDALVRAVGRASRGSNAPAAWPSRAPAGAAGEVPALAAALPAGDQLRDRAPEIHQALTVLAEASAGIPARKNLVLFTTGFGDVDRLGFYQPDTRYDRALVEALNAANLAVYAVDLVPTGTRHPFENFFSRIAGLTGGTAFLDVVQFGVPLARVARETNGYYLVAVRLRGTEAAAGYRRVEVAVANPELEVRTRSGLRFGSGG
jgi:VWFA-related protein